MTDPAARSMPIPSLGWTVLRDFLRVFKPLVIFEVLFKLAAAGLGMLVGSVVLQLLMRSAGTAAVTNTEIVDFLLSPVGVLVVAVIGLSALWITVLEHMGVMAIVARFERGDAVSVSGITRALASLTPRLLKLKAEGLFWLVLIASPLALLAGLTYAALLTRHDINYYLADRPPSFLAAVGIGGILGAVLLAILAWAYVRTVFTFPIILCEDLPARAAVRESLRRTEGAFLRLGTVLLGWQLVGVLLSGAAVWVFARLSGLLLLAAAARLWVLVPVVALLLAGHALLVSALSFVLVAIHCLLIVRLYRERNDALGITAGSPVAPVLEPVASKRAARTLRIGKIAGLISLGVFVALCYGVLQQFQVPGNVIVTAHKGFSSVAPENSLSAIKRAIEVGADYAEIDVQQTADGVIVLNHDRDLMRVAGISRRIAEMTLAEVMAADIGTRFDPRFAGERVPTLEEVIALARGRIKVQIEMKFYGRDRKLAGAVARLVEREHFEPECVVSSLNYEALVQARRVNPRLKTAAIVTVSIGDIDRLEVDALSVNARRLENRLIRVARARGKEVYAWTVDDPRRMITLMERGVSNIVTNVPDVLIRLRTEFAGLGKVERRLLAARYLLGLEPELDAPGTGDESP
jgi:glycerophosphoryl diester phosphodiesterase